MARPIIQPTTARLLECVINGMPFVSDNGRNNFHVQELRVYEDICKPYFTAELVIESQINTFELYLRPAKYVTLTFAAPRSDGMPTYREKFRVLSYESSPRKGDIHHSMVTTLSLIGEEYFQDRLYSITQNFSNMSGTAIAAYIHNAYLSKNGGLSVTESALGVLGTTDYPYAVNNQSPIKAIHDALDKSVFARYRTCAPIYFRDKGGYKIGPIQQFLETASFTGKFEHVPGQGVGMENLTPVGYNRVLNFKPVVPKDDDPGGRRSVDARGFSAVVSHFDFLSGTWIGTALGGGKGRNMVSRSVDELRQKKVIDKHGPGNWAQAEALLLGSLRYSKKYWCSVPLQTGINITCGTRIQVDIPIGTRPARLDQKVLFVPRLVHELRFTEGTKRDPVTVVGKTDMFCVEWEGFVRGIA